MESDPGSHPAAITLHQRAAIVADRRVDVERVDGIDAERQNLLGMLLARTGRRSKDGHVDILQFLDVLHHLILSKLGGFVLCATATHNSCDFEIGSGLECLDGIASDVAVAHYGGSDFLHLLTFVFCYIFFIVFAILLKRRTHIVFDGEVGDGQLSVDGGVERDDAL